MQKMGMIFYLPNVWQFMKNYETYELNCYWWDLEKYIQNYICS